jgi:hypothetical protein
MSRHDGYNAPLLFAQSFAAALDTRDLSAVCVIGDWKYGRRFEA